MSRKLFKNKHPKRTKNKTKGSDLMIHILNGNQKIKPILKFFEVNEPGKLVTLVQHVNFCTILDNKLGMLCRS